MSDDSGEAIANFFEDLNCRDRGEPSSVYFSYFEKDNLVKFLLKSWSLEAVLFKDKQPDFYRVVKSSDAVSKLMFPMVVQAIKTGSRADQIYLDTSDVDYMYEVGPMVIATSTTKNNVDLGNEILFSKGTSNLGFYTICDVDGGYVYPVVMQTKLAPIIREVKQVALLKETSAALSFQNENLLQSNEDSVIALKCMDWPDDIWGKFTERNPKVLQDIMPTLKDTPLYMVPKSHPESDNPWIEWRISFSLVEKEICVNFPSIFRKVYLLCKMLSSEWKKKFKFHSYILKTVFLWKYEDWGEQDKVYSEDDIIDMIIDVFLYLSKCYENKNIAMYFVPEMNLLEQYSKTKQEKLMYNLEIHHRATQPYDYRGVPKKVISRENLNNHLVAKSEASILKTLKMYTEKSSLVEIIRKLFDSPFHPLVTRENSVMSLEIMPEYDKRIDYRTLYHSSHQNLAILYTEKILKNNGIMCDEDELDLQCELYVTLLFLLHEKIFNPSKYDFELIIDYIFHIIYFLKVFGKNILEKDLKIKFIKRYCESIIVTTNIIREEIGSEFLVLGETGEPYLNFLERNFSDNSQHYIEMLNLNKANIGKLFMNGSLDEDLYLLLVKDERLSLQTFPYVNKPRKVVLRKGIYQYGDKNRSEEVQRLIEKKMFWQENKLFKGFVEAINENFIKKFYSRCLYEARKEQERDALEDSFKKKRSYLFRHLLTHMCEMYNYGFTENKFMLPTPALYISFLSQLSLNLQEYYIETKMVGHTTQRIPDKWGYTIKEGDNYIYRTYDERKHNTFLYNVRYIDV